MPESSQQTVFDFDHWSTLARDNPDEFEARRAAVIEEAIQRAPQRAHMQLRRMQWKLDVIRNTAGSPLGACVRMHEMMWERVVGEGGLLAVLQDVHGQARGKPRHSLPVARVIPFKPLNGKDSRRCRKNRSA